jgi:superfamily II DNA/RNA helicase
VVNYDCPADDKAYVHRIGRTGRAGRTGIAVTFVEWEELTRWKMINQTLGLDFPDPVETYSTSPHVFTELNIPAGTKGVLPRANRSRAGLSAEQVEDLGETGRPRVRSSVRGGPRREEREERERPARTPRQRRRTRGGKPADEAILVETPEVELVNGRSRHQEETPAIISTDEVETVAAEPRRRTRRTAPAQAAPVIDSVEPVVDHGPVTEPATEPKPIMEATPVTDTATEQAAVRAPSFSTPERQAPREPERIIPASPFSVIFQSPDLATDDDDIAPSAATERKQQRRQPRGGAPGGSGGNRRRMG